MDENTNTTKSSLLHKVCRMCADMNTKLYPIYENKLNEKIESFIPIEVRENDGLPDLICTLCKYKLDTACEFRLLAISVDKNLRNFFSNDSSLEENNLIDLALCKVEAVLGEDDGDSNVLIKIVEDETNINQEENKVKQTRKSKRKCVKTVKKLRVPSRRCKRDTIKPNECSTNDISLQENVIHENSKTNDIEIKDTNKTEKNVRKRPRRMDSRYVEVVCPECGILIKRRYLKTHLNQHFNIKDEEDPYIVCYECGKSIKKPYFNIHMKTHTMKYDKKCKSCDFVCNTNAQLWYHNKTRHREKTFIKCDKCEKSFLHNSHFHVHYKVAHLNLKTYKCEICDKSFGLSSTLTKHRRTHTGERPYICEICGRGLSSPFALKQHVRLHTNEAPYKCSECGQGFKQNVTMKLHFKRQHLGITPGQERVGQAEESL